MSAATAACWRHIGVYGGDQSCARLLEVLHCRNCPVFSAAALSLLDREAELQAEIDPVGAIGDGDGAETSVLVFRLGPQWLGLPPSAVAEVAPDEPVRRLAHRTAGRLEGVVNVRGELRLAVALIELVALGGRGAQGATGTRLVLLDDGRGGALGFRSDEVVGLQRFRRDAVEPAPDTLPPVLARCVTGMVRLETRHVALLDPAVVLSELERALFE